MQKKGSDSPPSGDYVLDSYALLAFFEAETGSDRVKNILEAAEAGKCRVNMCVVNLGEVVYITERERGLQKAQEVIARIDELPVTIGNADKVLTLAAAHLKTVCPISYADCFAAALAIQKGGILVTGDPEFRKVKPDCGLRVEWLV